MSSVFSASGGRQDVPGGYNDRPTLVGNVRQTSIDLLPQRQVALRVVLALLATM
jgi:hypothetical protein